MKAFWFTCFAYVLDKQKFDDRAREGNFVGYDPLIPVYLVYFKDTQMKQRMVNKMTIIANKINQNNKKV